jgi:ABC-type bacteriocin/lantibiotic exporter with double-glycine peptidase domain
MAKVGLLEEVLALPQGMNTMLVTGGRPLSTAQCVRLLVARAMVSRPRLLLLDEVLDGLGVDDMDGLAAELFDPDCPWTLLVATRDPAVVGLCSKVIRLTAPTAMNLKAH